jgi:hypothetical protein
MSPTGNIDAAVTFMQDFARSTGLDPVSPLPERYLWTDAFAVCNYLGLFQETGNARFRELALRLVDQVHHTLGRHRDDDPRAGWISGLSPDDGELHPTAGGLRIGKPRPERGIGEPYHEEREWDQDGQYYHYLTKWMHALCRMSRVTGDPTCHTWAIELAQVAHARFTFQPPGGGRRRMYWKMSIDLSRPLVSLMGQHDPLDGLVTYYELQLEDAGDGSLRSAPVLGHEIADMAGIVRGMRMDTDDPLGIGGLLSDGSRILRITLQGVPGPSGLLEAVLSSSLAGLDSFTRRGILDLPARHRLAFREFGLSTGLAGMEQLPALVENNPRLFAATGSLDRRIQAIMDYTPLRERIEQFWLDPGNRESDTWTGHRGINTVMLATSLAPGGFLAI